MPLALTGTSRPCAGLAWLSPMAPDPRARRRRAHATVLTLHLSSYNQTSTWGIFKARVFPGRFGGGIWGFFVCFLL